MTAKKNTALLSIFSNTILIILKVTVGFLTGSVSIISEAVHSATDWLAALIAFIAVRISAIPPDENHPYGHEKIENVSGVIEGLLIVLAAFWIIIEAVRKLTGSAQVESAGLGFAVMLVSAGINALVSARLYKVAKAEESVALEADALHLKADVYTSLGVAFGLLLIWVTGLHFLDPLVAILVALFILKEAFSLIKNAFEPLMDARLSDEDLAVIKNVLKSCESKFVDVHNLRTRKSGRIRYIDFHMTVCRETSIKQASNISEEIENDIKTKIPHCEVLIHLDPCEEADNPNCHGKRGLACPTRTLKP